ncbi:hypothetical protein COCON_G00115910 [Conger conger]|uniref:WASH complex subunit 3 n=1 Tax=Conger conger TaxID=82655 RepID=A0A9Q1DG32_CONCO|nr:WASH complex subunit 3 [Conger conger]KAJ8268984.1 hypothetical protein COCON_G00115910 [Conger conger]
MDEDGLPIVGSGIDLTKVPAIQQKRIVAFLNQFIVHTVRFLNRFSTVCEEKLANVSLRIQKIETTLSILEAKLSSIPGLEDVRIEAVGPAVDSNGPAMVTSQSQIPAATSPPEETPDQQRAEAVTENIPTVSTDPRYARYLKMVQVGVPVMAIKNKMINDGLDPSLLDTPNALVPDVGKKDGDDDSSSGESSFSD